MLRDLVLVWDMDQTLIGNYFSMDTVPLPELDFNERARRLLRLASALRPVNVAAILLLTNNTDKRFISHVMSQIGIKFDNILDGNRGEPESNGQVPKSLEDVERMLTDLGLSTENLAARTFFFDDIPTHRMRKDIDPSHYIVITPPYKNDNDETNYKAVYDAFATEGGKRKKRKSRRNKKHRVYGKKKKNRTRVLI